MRIPKQYRYADCANVFAEHNLGAASGGFPPEGFFCTSFATSAKRNVGTNKKCDMRDTGYCIPIGGSKGAEPS